MPRLFPGRHGLGALLLLTAAGSVTAAGFPDGANRGTLARAFALPAFGQGPVLPRGRGSGVLALDLTNEYVRQGNCSVECLTLDGETARLVLGYRRGLPHGWEAGFLLPMLDTGGGFLDRSIEGWHAAFGLPNGGREQSPQDRYRYRYERGGEVLLDETEPREGLGDVVLTVGRQLAGTMALRGMAKLATGEETALLGGNAGGALWLEAQLPFDGSWRGYLAVGASANERGRFLPDRQTRVLPIGGAGVMVPLSPRLHLSVQVTAHGRLYDRSSLAALSRAAAPLSVGVGARIARRLQLHVGFQEDLAVDASPDFGVHAILRYGG